MKILFNALVVTDKSFGYSTVVCSLLQSICIELEKENSDNLHFYVVCQRRAIHIIDPNSVLQSSKFFKFVLLPNIDIIAIRVFFEQVILNVLTLFYKCKVVYMPASLGLFFSFSKQVLFFHNSGTFLLSRKMDGRSKFSAVVNNFLLKHSCKNSFLLTTTHTTASELFAFLKYKIPYTVIGNGIKSFPNVLSEFSTDTICFLKSKKFILFVSSFYRLKNQILLVELSRKFGDEYVFVLAGNPAQVDYYNECTSRSTTNVLFVQPGDEELKWLYMNCSLYIMPSLFEGFSLTPLEALVMNKPILLSDIPVHKEVYGDGIIYFNPYDADDLYSKITIALSDLYLKRCLEIKHVLLKKYSWPNIAKQNIKILKLLLLVR